MQLYLVRHAIAETRDPRRWPDDAERPLTTDGEARFRRAAHGLRRLVPAVDVVLSSPYVRAWQTAVVLHEEARWVGPEHCTALVAEAAAADVLPSLAERTESSVALVGHEPFLSRLVSLLLAGSADAIAVELKKGAVARIDLDADLHGAVLRWSLSPRVLRMLAR